jgi:hypothetical protein
MPVNPRYVLSIFLVLAFGTRHPAQAQDVERVDVREGGLVGHFYVVASASRRTGLLMLGGSGGGYPDEAAARDLARAGHPVLALAYFRDYGGDPPELEQKQPSQCAAGIHVQGARLVGGSSRSPCRPHRPDGRITWGGIALMIAL